MPRPDSSLRVLFVNDHLGFEGGVTHGGTTYLVTVLPALVSPSLSPRLCVLRAWHPAASQLESVGIRPTFLSRSKWDPAAVRDLLGLVSEQRIDVLHLNGMKAHLIGRLAAWKTGRPAVVHQHNVIRQGRLLRLLQRSVPRGRVKYVAVSKAAQELSSATFGVPREAVEVLHNGMNVDKYATPSTPDARSRIRESWGVDEDRPLLGVFGRVFDDKGQDRLIRALQLVHEERPDCMLVVVGEGPDRPRYTELARDLGLEDSVRFTGQRDDVPDLLAAVDFVAVPSMWEEAFGYTALEASAAGRAVIAFASGGLTEVVAQDRTGLIVPKGDIPALSRAVLRLLSDPDLRERLGRNGREHARLFSVERHADRLRGIYASLLN